LDTWYNCANVVFTENRTKIKTLVNKDINSAVNEKGNVKDAYILCRIFDRPLSMTMSIEEAT
jgi:hypothetical protein